MQRAPDPSMHGDWILAELEPEKEKPSMLTGWRTIIFNAALAVVGVLQTANWVDVLPSQYVAPLVAVIGMVGIWLRSITKTPVGVK